MLFGMIFLRKRIIAQEFFLRRICRLSLYAFMIASVPAELSWKRKTSAIYETDELHYLAYLPEEAR